MDKTPYFLSVEADNTTYFFNVPIKCTYTIKFMYYYQLFPTCFGAYCTIFRENSRYAQYYRYIIVLQVLSYIMHGITTLFTNM
jgi:hypothetical protein